MIRERIGKGESNGEIRDFLVSRYGDFILLKPPFKLSTALLWLSAPLTFLLGGARDLVREPPQAGADCGAERERGAVAQDAGGSGRNLVARRRRPRGASAGASEAATPVSWPRLDPHVVAQRRADIFAEIAAFDRHGRGLTGATQSATWPSVTARPWVGS